MFISQNLKDIVDIVGAVGTPLTIIGGLLGFWKWTLNNQLVATAAKQKGEVAMEQINSMATNHFPHMEADLKTQTQTLSAIHDTQGKQLEALNDIAGNIKVLVDRGIRV